MDINFKLITQIHCLLKILLIYYNNLKDLFKFLIKLPNFIMINFHLKNIMDMDLYLKTIL